MKNHLASLTLSSLLLTSGLAHAGAWIDSYWPLNNGDDKSFIYQGVNQLTIHVTDQGAGEYQIYAGSPDGSASEFHQITGTAIYLGRAKAGWVNVYLNPPVLLMNDSLLQNGGSAATSFCDSLALATSVDHCHLMSVPVPA